MPDASNSLGICVIDRRTTANRHFCQQIHIRPHAAFAFKVLCVFRNPLVALTHIIGCMMLLYAVLGLRVDPSHNFRTAKGISTFSFPRGLSAPPITSMLQVEVISMETVKSGAKRKAKPVTSTGVCVLQERAFGGIATPIAKQTHARIILKHKTADVDRIRRCMTAHPAGVS